LDLGEEKEKGKEDVGDHSPRDPGQTLYILWMSTLIRRRREQKKDISSQCWKMYDLRWKLFEIDTM